MGDPGDTRDPRLTFGTVVDAYDEIRPTYPEALFDEFFALLVAGRRSWRSDREPARQRGTCLPAAPSSMPSRSVRRWPAGCARTFRRERLRVSVGDFETIDLAAQSADAVFSASAYHWISPAAQLDRPALILRPGGVLAIVGLFQVDSPEDRGFYAAAQPIYERYGQADEGPPTEARPDVEPSIAQALAADPRLHRRRRPPMATGTRRTPPPGTGSSMLCVFQTPT